MEMVRSVLDSTDEKDDAGGSRMAGAGRAGLYACLSGPLGSLSFLLQESVDNEQDGKVWMLTHSAMRLVVSALPHKDSVGEALNIISETVGQAPPMRAFDLEMVSLATGSCYMALGEYARAEKEFGKLSALASSDKEIDRYIWAETNREIILTLGNFYPVTHHYDKAESYAKQLGTVPGNII